MQIAWEAPDFGANLELFYFCLLNDANNHEPGHRTSVKPLRVLHLDDVLIDNFVETELSGPYCIDVEVVFVKELCRRQPRVKSELNFFQLADMTSRVWPKTDIDRSE